MRGSFLVGINVCSMLLIKIHFKVTGGIDASTLRKRINDFPKGSICKIGTTYTVTWFGMHCVFGLNKR